MQTTTNLLTGPMATPTTPAQRAAAAAACRAVCARMQRAPRRVYAKGYTWVPLPVANTLASGLASLGYAVAQAYAALPLHVRTQVHAHTAAAAAAGNVAAAHALLHMWGG